MIFAVVPAELAVELGDRVMKAAADSSSLPTVHLHDNGGIEDLALPEYATEAVQGWKLGVLAGGGAGLLAGILAGATGMVQGLGPQLGGALGLLSGVLVGALCAVMSGHRRAHPALRKVADALESHERLLTIDLPQGNDGSAIWRDLERSSLRVLDTL